MLISNSSFSLWCRIKLFKITGYWKIRPLQMNLQISCIEFNILCKKELNWFTRIQKEQNWISKSLFRKYFFVLVPAWWTGFLEYEQNLFKHNFAIFRCANNNTWKEQQTQQVLDQLFAWWCFYASNRRFDRHCSGISRSKFSRNWVLSTSWREELNRTITTTGSTRTRSFINFIF